MNQKIEPFVRELNDAWQEGRFEDLARFYHPDVVLLPPDAGELIRGRDAVVQTYRAFESAATLHEFTVTALEIFDYTTTAVVHLHFAVEFSVQGQRLREAGFDVYVLNDIDTQPVIVWRSQNILESREIT